MPATPFDLGLAAELALVPTSRARASTSAAKEAELDHHRVDGVPSGPGISPCIVDRDLLRAGSPFAIAGRDLGDVAHLRR
jgi:hypothetical protein